MKNKISFLNKTLEQINKEVWENPTFDSKLVCTIDLLYSVLNTETSYWSVHKDHHIELQKLCLEYLSSTAINDMDMQLCKSFRRFGEL